MNEQTICAGIFGASGYTGQELVALLARHPRMRLDFATSEAEAGRRVPGTDLDYVSADTVDPERVDLVFCCLPHEESGDLALRASSAGAAVVDLSNDLRAGRGGAVYGVPELWRSEIAGRRLVANPGCYPTGALIALAPAIRAGLLDPEGTVVIDAASGVTGAGRSAKRELLFGEISEDFRAYGVGNRHRHVPEITAGFKRLGGAPEFVFTPHLLPIRRGILETIYLPLTGRVSLGDAVAVWRDAYAGEPFVEILGEELPGLRRVVGRNVVALGFSLVEISRPMLMVVAALDNLLKGAAGQAVQNANLMFGWDEREGLPR